MGIPAFAYFVFLLFLIPSLAISAYALLIYRLISRIESRARYLTTPLVALTLAITITALLETEIVKNMAHATLFGNFFMWRMKRVGNLQVLVAFKKLGLPVVTGGEKIWIYNEVVT